MKKLAMLGILLIAVLALAQTFGPPSIGSNGPIATNPSQCPTAPAHAYSLCPVETGVGTGTIYISINGAAPVLLQGAPGPMGPVGPQGPPGPVQSFNTNVCTSWSGGTTGVSMTGCKQSTP